MPPHSTRRAFLANVAAAGLAAGVPLGWYGARTLFPRHGAAGARNDNNDLTMPGRFPGKVVEIRSATCVRSDHSIDRAQSSLMLDQGMRHLVGTDSANEAWKTFFQKGDAVGIKVNPVGRKPTPKDGNSRVQNAVGCISSFEVIIKIVEELKDAGVRPRDIVLFERYADEFVEAGYAKLMKEPPLAGVRWLASSASYSGEQVDITGFDAPRSSFAPEVARQVVGYDPDVFQHMDFDAPEHDRKDDRRFRSHLSAIVTRVVDKFINVACLKDHRSAGITGALKNMSHGMNNNVARSHVAGLAPAGSKRDNNRCDLFIPTAVNQKPLKEKATLHIVDGLIGVYEGGPGCWNKTWGTWRHGGLLFATDPVALDAVCWRIIDAQRAQMGWPAVGEMGLLQHDATHIRAATGLVDLHAGGPLEQLTLRAARQHLQAGQASESFSRRQPEHIELAARLGLGKCEDVNWSRLALALPG